jgi:peptidyl-prolyl cis-trans isomerase SurA
MNADPRLPGFFLLVMAFGSSAETATPDYNKPVALNSIVAVVNNDIIVRSELDKTVEQVLKSLKEKGTTLPPGNVLEKQVLEKIILERLQLQLGETTGIKIDDNTLNSELQKLAKRNSMTLTEFREVIEKDGYDYRDFREDIRKELILAQLRMQMVGRRIKVTDQEVDNLLANLSAGNQGNATYRLAHILVALPEAANPDEIQAAEAKAAGILERLNADEDFAGIAIAESDGQSALEGGELGWRSIGQLPTMFVEPVQTMAAGELSGLIRSPGGFHIIKLLEMKGGERYIIQQTRARHILIKPDAIHSDEECRVRIEMLAARIQGGDDFATIARASSQDTVSAARGGDLGWISLGDMVPEFETAMNATTTGGLSPVFKSRFGWHVLQVTDHRDYDNTDEFKRSRARQLIRKRKTDEQLFLWLRRLRDEAYIDYRLAS